jgi:hypothetical protein
MLRKVTAGKNWGGPPDEGTGLCPDSSTPNVDDLCVYTTDGTNAINFNNGGYATINVSGTDRQLYYIYGDWMAPLPSVVYGTTALGTIGATNGYTCGACHTTGYKDNTYPGVRSIGGVLSGVEPQESFPGIILSASADPKWSLEGIQCARCHNANVGPVTAGMIALSTYPTTYATGGGMGNIPGGPEGGSKYATYLCFGCHQSMGKTWPAGTTQYDPTLVPTGVSHGASPGRDFNGHVIGNEFLNSPHARFTGTVRANSVGKFDLDSGYNATGTRVWGGTYDSAFQGYTCWQSPSSTSPAKTKNAAGDVIKTKAECETLYGAGSWRSDNQQGSCSSCHDVHQSLFMPNNPAPQASEGLRKECVDCHSDASYKALVPLTPQVNMANINHPSGLDTPQDYPDPCIMCHMAVPAQDNGPLTLPLHVWRINTDPNYDTFPTADQFNGTNGQTKERNATKATETYYKTGDPVSAPSGSFANAVWVDIDLACGGCHGGGISSATNPPSHGAWYRTKSWLAAKAVDMHNVKVDLAVASVLTPATAKRGVTVLTLKDATQNRMKGSAVASVTRAWLSTTPNLTGVVGLALGSRAVPALGALATNTGSIAGVVIPIATVPGNYYIVWQADATNTNAEASETNNTRAMAIKVNL